jgi:hypothetical protein
MKREDLGSAAWRRQPGAGRQALHSTYPTVTQIAPFK